MEKSFELSSEEKVEKKKGVSKLLELNLNEIAE